MKTACFGLAAVAAAGVATTTSAAQISDVDTFTGSVPSTLNVTLDQFDDLGGTLTLTSVQLIVQTDISADVTGENDSNSSGQLTLNLSGSANATFGGLDATALVNLSEGPISVGASDGTPDSGPDFHDFGNVIGSDDADDLIISGFSPFIGTGTISVPVDISGGFTITGVTDSSLSVSNFQSTGSVEVIYDYVPEPASAILMGAGLLCLSRRRRA